MTTPTEWYVRITKPEHHRSDKRGIVKRSVLIMEEYLGRSLLLQEEVHHINGIVTDDRIENLELLTRKEHQSKYNNLDKYNHRPRHTKGRPFYGTQFVKVKWQSA